MTKFDHFQATNHVFSTVFCLIFCWICLQNGCFSLQKQRFSRKWVFVSQNSKSVIWTSSETYESVISRLNHTMYDWNGIQIRRMKRIMLLRSFVSGFNVAAKQRTDSAILILLSIPEIGFEIFIILLWFLWSWFSCQTSGLLVCSNVLGVLDLFETWLFYRNAISPEHLPFQFPPTTIVPIIEPPITPQMVPVTHINPCLLMKPNLQYMPRHWHCEQCIVSSLTVSLTSMRLSRHHSLPENSPHSNIIPDFRFAPTANAKKNMNTVRHRPQRTPQRTIVYLTLSMDAHNHPSLLTNASVTPPPKTKQVFGVYCGIWSKMVKKVEVSKSV